MSKTRIEQFGWRGAVEPGIGRVVSAHGDYYHLVCNEQGGEILARKKKSAFLDASAIRPTTGDFVRFRYNPTGESTILSVFPRFSVFERKDPTARRKSQTLAVNFDTLFVMMSLNENFSLPRLERFLALAGDMGEAEAKVVLTKSDLPGANALPDVAGSIRISSVTGEGIDRIEEIVAPGRTVAFIGSSGVGKSTLLNTLAGEEWAATREIQEWSDKGRHTTTSRELVMLPNGAMVVDTPGIREIGMVGETERMQAKGESTHRWRK
ncbi:MAG: GTPase RsgA [Kiritimatiellae bacterium]|nr:GTPase RsgA [Kiritimatiellia bacterium]